MTITNEEKILKRKQFYNDNKDNILVRQKEYSNNNKNKIKEKGKKYYNINKEEILKRNILNTKNRLKTDPLFKFKENIRKNIKKQFKNGKGGKNTIEILGCSFEEFKLYIESKFEPWMTWQNYGNWNGYPKELNTAWDFDHIIPVSSATTEEEVLKLNNYTNFQPLCSFTNRYIKRDNIDFKKE